MKLVKEIPEIENKINVVEISLTHIGLAQSLFKQEKKFKNEEMSHDQKLLVFQQIAHKPVREAERITLSLSSAPEITKPDRVNSVSEKYIEMTFIASSELRKKVEQRK